MIFIAQKQMPDKSRVLFIQVKSLEPPYPDVLTLIQQEGQYLPPDALNGADWSLTSAQTASLLRKMRVRGVPLSEYIKGQIYYGIKTGFNEAFVIDGARRAELIAQDVNSAEIIKPLAVGDDIRRWRIEYKDKWLIVTRIGVDMARYPAIFAHWQQWQPQLEKRWDKGNYWWELRACDYYEMFDKPKIIYPIIAKEPRFTLDITGTFTNDKTFLLPVSDLYLLGVLNSTLVWHYLGAICSVLGDPNKGGRLELRAIYVSQIPIPDPTAEERAAIEGLVRRLLDARGQGPQVAAWEAELNRWVYRVYRLTEAEIHIVEGG